MDSTSGPSNDPPAWLQQCGSTSLDPADLQEQLIRVLEENRLVRRELELKLKQIKKAFMTAKRAEGNRETLDDNGFRVDLGSIKIEVVDNPEVDRDTDEESAEFPEEGRNEEHCQEISFPPRAIVHSAGCPMWRNARESSGNLEGTDGGDLGKRKEFKGIGKVEGAEIGGEVRGNQLLRMGSFGGIPEVLEFAGNLEEINHGGALDYGDGHLLKLNDIKYEIVDNPEGNFEEETAWCQEGMNEETFQGYQIVDVKLESPEDPEVATEERIMETGGNPEKDPEDGRNEVEMELEGMNDNDDQVDGGMQDLNKNVGNGEGIDGERGENLVVEGQDDLDGMPLLTSQLDDVQEDHVREDNNGPPPVLQKEATFKCSVCHRGFGNAGLLACHVKKRHPEKFVKKVKKVGRKPKKQSKLDPKKKKNESNIPGCTDFVMFEDSVPTLKQDVESTTKNKKIPCPKCPRQFGNRGAFGMHMKHHHAEPKKRGMKPNQSLEVTEGPSDKMSDTDDKMGDFTCPGCLFKFKANSKAELVQHKKLSH